VPNIEPLFSSEAIAERVEQLAADIALRWPDEIMIIGLLRGSFVFAADLVRALHRRSVRVQMDFMTLSSYGKEKTSAGQVVVQRDITESVHGRSVLVIDDILESGRTLAEAVSILKSRGASEVAIAVLLEKPGKRVHAIDADMVGFIVPDKFVVGYGLDYQNYWRELPYIGVLCD
jgi:hypoxanthine phosphoribosyltransferase